MKKYLLFFTSITISLNLIAQDFGWAIKQSGNDNEGVYRIAEDGSGNIYEAGNFWGTVDFDPSAVIYNLTSSGVTDNFICKLDASGNLLWAKKFGSVNYDFADNLVATSSGDLFAAGRFQLTVDFDLSAGTYNLTSSGGDDAFISAYNTNGDFKWAAKFGSTGADYVEGIVEADGNIYATGYFQGTVDFDPGSGVYNLTATGPDAAFIIKLNADGKFIWAKSISGTSSTVAFDIGVDADGGVYTGGEFWGTTDFDPGAGVKNKTASGFTADAFLLKLDSNGNYNWVNIIIGSSNDWVRSIDIGNDGNVAVSGAFESTTDFDAGTGVYNLTSKGNYDMFIASYSMDAGVFGWAISCGGTSNDQCYGFDVSETGDCFLTGFFSGLVDFDPGPGSFLIDAGSSSDIFYLQLNSSGEFKQAYGFGSTSGGGTGFTVYADVAGRITMAGGFENTVDFDPGAGVFNFTSINTTSDCFVVQFNSCIPVETNLNATICFGDSVFAEGNFQKTSGEYVDYFLSASGCDSIVTLSLTVMPLNATNISATICKGETYLFNGNNITVQGTYVAIYDAVSGCDSIVYLNLTVTEIDATLTQNGDTLIANGNGSIQWIFCETGLPASEENDNIFIPSADGLYAAIISNGSCTDTTECAGVFTLINSQTDEQKLLIFPNPSTHLVTIQLNSTQPVVCIQLRNALGEILKEQSLPSAKCVFDLQNISGGVYFIYLIAGDKIFVEKILKE